MAPCKSTAEEVSFEWSHHRILSTDLKVRTTLHVSIIDSERKRVKYRQLVYDLKFPLFQPKCIFETSLIIVKCVIVCLVVVWM